MSANEDLLNNLKEILQSFAVSTGLKVNFAKSSLVPINIEPARATVLADAFGCQVGAMPFTYLGLPLGTRRPLVNEYLPLLNRIERRMMGLSTFLSYAGRLVLVNSVVTSMPNFYLCTLKFPAWFIKQIDSYKKHCLWDKGDINRKGGCLVAWENACKSKEQGGLGIIDIKTQNTSLLMKFLHKFYNHEDIPWVTLTWQCLYTNLTVPQIKRPVGSFWWRDVMSLSDQFFRIAFCNVNQGSTVCFWTDLWNLFF